MVSRDQEPHMSLLLCLASQPGTSLFKREMAFLCTGQVPKHSQNFMNSPSTPHLAQGGRIGISWFTELTEPLAGKQDSLCDSIITFGRWFQGRLGTWLYLTRVSFQAPQCSVIHSAIVAMLTKGKHCFLI